MSADQQRGQPKQPPAEAGAGRSDGADSASLAIALEDVTPESLCDFTAAGGPASDKAGAGRGPRITASGRGAVAEQILQIAFDRGVKVRQDSDLAEILSVVEVDSEIPLAALAGVAEILRYLYQTDDAAGEATETQSQADSAAFEETSL
ncbi:EscU/YscU/HrcU family type III secretion system export apparatus switch protein [Pelagibius sp.]|uniref:EscU/YscU/HrcU family type III secretion system export apparatus switch protein n=1 Tax=Pelagibius sp. TaxID=1931238 RepID=UPI00260B833F|nr:EscU/YscU/HrcU family type III secretion system export apparatus switch protein [Pelagibius sp.]